MISYLDTNKIVQVKAWPISLKNSEIFVHCFSRLSLLCLLLPRKTLPGLTVESPSQQSHGFSIQYSSTAVTELYTNSEMTIVIHCLLCALLNRKTNIIESVCM